MINWWLFSRWLMIRNKFAIRCLASRLSESKWWSIYTGTLGYPAHQAGWFNAEPRGFFRSHSEMRFEIGPIDTRCSWLLNTVFLNWKSKTHPSCKVRPWRNAMNKDIMWTNVVNRWYNWPSPLGLSLRIPPIWDAWTWPPNGWLLG